MVAHHFQRQMDVDRLILDKKLFHDEAEEHVRNNNKLSILAESSAVRTTSDQEQTIIRSVEL